MERMLLCAPSGGGRRPPICPLHLAQGGIDGGRPSFYRRRGRWVSFPPTPREPPALVARGLLPLEPVLGGGRTTVRQPRREDADAGLDLTEFLSVGFLGQHVDRSVLRLPLGAQAPPPEDLPAGRAQLRRAFAGSLGAAFALAVAVERAEDGNGNGVALAPLHHQLPGAAAVHAIQASSSLSSAPAAAPTGGVSFACTVAAALYGLRLPRGPQAPPTEELPAGNARVRRAFANSLGVAVVLALSVAPRHQLPSPPEGANATRPSPTSGAPQQLPPDAAAVHAIPAASSSSPAPAAAPTMPTPSTSDSDDEGIFFTVAISFGFAIALTRN